MARTFYAESLSLLRDVASSNGGWREADVGDRIVVTDRWFVGTVFALDPCGRYHHHLSPNGANARCGAFWDALDKAADRLGGSIEAGEGDPCDVFFERTAELPA